MDIFQNLNGNECDALS